MVENFGEGSDGMWAEVIEVEVGYAGRACGEYFFCVFIGLSCHVGLSVKGDIV